MIIYTADGIEVNSRQEPGWQQCGHVTLHGFGSDVMQFVTMQAPDPMGFFSCFGGDTK